MKRNFKIRNSVEKYAGIIHSRNNKQAAFHRWYPFTESFAGDLVNSILRELDYNPSCCLDPFAGSGTTPVVCQEHNLKCISFEINPFLFDLMRIKLKRAYNYDYLSSIVETFRKNLKEYRRQWKHPEIETQTLFEKKGLKKWVLNKEVVWGILDVLQEIQNIKNDSKSLFKVALASNLVKVSNVFRNGKCLSYRSNWQQKRVSRKDVHNKFLETCALYLKDILNLCGNETSNSEFCLLGDARELTHKLEKESVDLVITSPPYLNSRDYTDVYRLELWILGYIKTFTEERELRRNSLRSHVQITWGEEPILEVSSLKQIVEKMMKQRKTLWNRHIPRMINGYFVDLHHILRALHDKLKAESNLYFVVGNSYYEGIRINVDLILAEMAEQLNYKVQEIRVGRFSRTSGQQNSKRIRESVVVLKKS